MTIAHAPQIKGRPESEQPGLGAMARYFLRLGFLGFGGPIALAARMQTDLVEERHWIAPADYAEGLAFSQLSPGPLAAQLAMYLGWIRGGAFGATVVAGAFILPSFLMVVVLAAAYLRAGQLFWLQGLFYGIGAAIIAIIAIGAYKLSRKALGKDVLLWTMFAVTMATTAWKESEFVWLFVLCGLTAILIKAPPRPGTGMHVFSAVGFPRMLGAASVGTLGTLFLFFLKAGAFVFGSGLAIVPFLYGGVVLQYHWLTERQFVDAVAVAMITPGPVVITAGFIGYLVAGPVGAVAAAFAVFAPPYLLVVTGAPYYRRLANNQQIAAFVQGVTAAAVGAITGAAIVLGRRALVDTPTLTIGLLSFFALLALKKIPEPVLILAAGAAGVLLFKGH